jgi:hypothetical protein
MTFIAVDGLILHVNGVEAFRPGLRGGLMPICTSKE